MLSPGDPHTEEALGKIYDRALMRRLLAPVVPHVGLAVTAVALIIVSSLLQLFGPLATAVALDLFIRPAGTGEAPKAAVSRWVEGALAGR